MLMCPAASLCLCRLSELQDPGLLHMFVKQAITMSLDRKDRERELVSVLLSALYGKVRLDGRGLWQHAWLWGFCTALSGPDA